MGNRGSFLLETMISLVILSIMAIVFAQGFGRTSGSIRTMGDDRTLLKLAQAEMERLKGLGFGNNNIVNGLALTGINAATGLADSRINGPVPVVLDGGNHNIEYKWTVTGINAVGNETAVLATAVYKRVALTTTMDANNARAITLATLVGDN